MSNRVSCPTHGPGKHVTGQAFGRGQEWFCAHCGDTFTEASETTFTARRHREDLTELQIAVKLHDAAIQTEKDTRADRNVEIRAALARRVPQNVISQETRLSREQVRKIGKGRSTP